MNDSCSPQLKLSFIKLRGRFGNVFMKALLNRTSIWQLYRLATAIENKL